MQFKTMSRAAAIIGCALILLAAATQRSSAVDDGKAPAKPKARANRLARETSPYLLLHAHNPVDWYPWGPEAFEKARKEGKLIFLSVGYSSCYWCHVMERKVFMSDASGSMTSYNAMQVAKAALMSSLQALDERQQFLIIFYEDKPHVVTLKDELKPTLANATEINKTLARQKIAGIQPGSGTDHLPALELAMKMNPDVIFFLTDALDPPLWPRDLEKIKLANGGRIRIHSIEFGQGSEAAEANDQGNFLRRLARQNGGTYRYHDVTRFKAQ